MARKVRNSKIDTPSARAKLKARGEPYWAPVSAGRAIGYRKGKQSSAWVAKWISPQKIRHIETLKGAPDDLQDADGVSILNYSQIVPVAYDWFARMEQERGATRVWTVSDALDAYMQYLAEEKSSTTAYDSGTRIEKHIRAPLGGIVLSDLTTDQIRAWRSGLLPAAETDPETNRKAKYGANKLLVILKAALNRAFRDGKVHSDLPWRRIRPFQKVNASRQVHLTPAQCTRLINVCQDSFRDLVTGALITGARYGELAQATVGGFRSDLGILHIDHGKTGPRDIYLDDQGLRFLESITAGRDPDGYLFTKDDSTPWGKNHHIRLMKAAAKQARMPKGMVFYSLRHSYISQRLVSGINLQLLAENCGTSVLMIEKHYGKFIRSARQDMIRSTAPDLKIGTTGNVMEITATGGKSKSKK